MSQYYSKMYRGFLVQQTDRGWVVPQMPSWSNGPVSQGPYSTYQIACHVLDRCIDNQESKTSSRSESPRRIQSSVDESESLSNLTLDGFKPYIVIYGGFFAFMDLLSHEHPIRFLITSTIIIWAYRTR